MSWRTRRCVASLPRPYRGLPLGCVATCISRVAGHVVHCASRRVTASPRALLRVVSQPPRSCREPSRPCRSACTAVSWHVSRHTQQPGYGHALPTVSQGLLAVSWPLQPRPAILCHDTIYCIVIHFPVEPKIFILNIFFLFYTL